MDIKVTKDKYTIDGIPHDRVTAVLDYFMTPGLLAWRDKVGLEEAKKQGKVAKAIGTRVHGLIKKHWETGNIALTKNDGVSVVNCMKAYQRWREAEGLTIANMEKMIYNSQLGLAGTLDMILDDDTIVETTSARDAYFGYMENI